MDVHTNGSQAVPAASTAGLTSQGLVAGQFTTQRLGETGFTAALTTDSHTGSFAEDDFPIAILDDVVRNVAADRPDFMLALGDNVAWYRRHLGPLSPSCPHFGLIGNWEGESGKFPEESQRLMAAPSGPLDSVLDDVFRIEDWTLGAAQMSWLRPRGSQGGARRRAGDPARDDGRLLRAGLPLRARPRLPGRGRGRHPLHPARKLRGLVEVRHHGHRLPQLLARLGAWGLTVRPDRATVEFVSQQGAVFHQFSVEPR